MARIFHCADIHLDSVFSLFTPREAESRRTELRAAFTSALLAAKDFGAEIFVISGDLFDGEYVTKDTKELLESEFAKYPNCRFFISPGNHDPLKKGSPYLTMKLPENVFVFGESRQCVEIPELGVDVYGFGYTSRICESSPVAGWQIKNPHHVNILVCHGDTTGGDSEVGPITMREIAESGFDYIALGHIHKGTGLQKSGNVFFAYPGCIEGRGFDETGRKGALRGIVTKQGTEMQQILLSKRRYEAVTVDIDGCDEKLTALEVIRREIKSFGDDTALRITLVGELKKAFLILENEIGSGASFPYRIEIIDNTTLTPDLGELERSNTLKGVFCRRMAEAMAQLSPDSREYRVHAMALKLGLCALDDREISGINAGGAV